MRPGDETNLWTCGELPRSVRTPTPTPDAPRAGPNRRHVPNRTQQTARAVRYFQRVAQPDEKLVFHTTIHWMVYVPAILFLLLALAAIAVDQALGLQGREHTACWAAAVVLGIIAVIAFFRAFVRRITTEIAVTDRRVLFKRGLLSRHTVEMNVSKIETVDVEQTLWGRLFNYGNVVIRGTGGTFEPLLGIESPLQLRNAIIVG